MNSGQIHKLAQEGEWRNSPLNAKVVETHISWVLLARDFVFKIKKPVKFSFLDFSSLERRKHYCEREIELNSRLTDIYLDVVPITFPDAIYEIGESSGKALEYAVRMKRQDSALEMDKMLKAGKVQDPHIEKLAKIMAGFHDRAEMIKEPFDIEKMQADFNDILTVQKKGEAETTGVIKKAVEYSNRFLNKHRKLIEDRVAGGFRRDLHGDFHSGNIFLTKNPIVFDCIEFNDTLRYVDILDELAFFCMDLEAHGQKALSDKFLSFYQAETHRNSSDRELELFNYYKLYRANVRAKVNLLKKGRHAGASAYLGVMKRYI